MYARISSWRFPAAEWERLDQALAPALAELSRQPGYIAGYGVRTGPDTSVTFSVWETEEQLEAGLGAILAPLGQLMQDGRVELVDRTSGPAQELGQPWSPPK